MVPVKDILHGLSKLNPYGVVVVLFLAFTFTTGDSSLYRRYTYDEKIRSLESEINRYNEQIKADRQKLHDLQMDKTSLERYARETFLMKKANEDLYLVK
jgi:cell division protein FtsB